MRLSIFPRQMGQHYLQTISLRHWMDRITLPTSRYIQQIRDTVHTTIMLHPGPKLNRTHRLQHILPRPHNMHLAIRRHHGPCLQVPTPLILFSLPHTKCRLLLFLLLPQQLTIQFFHPHMLLHKCTMRHLQPPKPVLCNSIALLFLKQTMPSPLLRMFE